MVQVTHTVASTCAGLAAALLGTPADVIKARMMNQGLNSMGQDAFYR